MNEISLDAALFYLLDTKLKPIVDANADELKIPLGKVIETFYYGSLLSKVDNDYLKIINAVLEKASKDKSDPLENLYSYVLMTSNKLTLQMGS